MDTLVKNDHLKLAGYLGRIKKKADKSCELIYRLCKDNIGYAL
jgi:hypothetical protein